MSNTYYKTLKKVNKCKNIIKNPFTSKYINSSDDKEYITSYNGDWLHDFYKTVKNIPINSHTSSSPLSFTKEEQ